jgi:hypothetical protein
MRGTGMWLVGERAQMCERVVCNAVDNITRPEQANAEERSAGSTVLRRNRECHILGVGRYLTRL